MERKILTALLLCLTAAAVTLGALRFRALRQAEGEARSPAPPAPRTEVSSPAPETAPPDSALPVSGPAGADAPADGAGSPEGPSTEELVGEALLRFAGEQPGRWSLYWQRLPAGDPVYVATDSEPMVSASLIKLCVMGAVYERLEQGELDRETAYPQLRAMIAVSDNASANALIRLLGGGDAEAGMRAVNAWCEAQGLADTSLQRLMLQDNGLQNYTSAGDCGRLLAALYRGEMVSERASEEMRELLLQQTVNDRLPALLPPGTPVAHKTGDLSGLCCGDAGIVYSPGGDYVLCAICNDQPYDAAARDAIAALSAQIWALTAAG